MYRVDIDLTRSEVVVMVAHCNARPGEPNAFSTDREAWDAARKWLLQKAESMSRRAQSIESMLTKG